MEGKGRQVVVHFHVTLVAVNDTAYTFQTQSVPVWVRLRGSEGFTRSAKGIFLAGVYQSDDHKGRVFSVICPQFHVFLMPFLVVFVDAENQEVEEEKECGTERDEPVEFRD